MKKTVHIIGSGFSGLTLAWELCRRGMTVHIYDENKDTGGLIRSTRTATHLREAAANGMLWNPRLNRLSRELGLEIIETSEDAKKRFIFREGLKRWPLKIRETAAVLEKVSRFFYHLKIKKNSQMTPFRGETITQWCERNATQTALNYLVQPGLQGIYAGDTSQMSATLIAKALGGGKGTKAPKNGMSALIQALEKQLLKKGVRFSMNSKMGKSEMPPADDILIVATSAWKAAEILKEKAPELSELLAKIHSVPLVSVTSIWNKPESKLGGFGCLFPPIEKFHSLGALANVNIFSNRGPDYSETWILGGAMKQNICSSTDEELKNLLLEDRSRMLGSKQAPDEIFIERYVKALPHYDLVLEDVLEKLKLPINIYLTGNYLGRIGLAKIYDQNIQLAEKIGQSDV